jgi:serine/threonine protein kinase
MEFVGGGDLQPYTTPETLLPLAEVLEIARKCCIALGYASRCGVIHRDLKPANILRAGAGEIRISDFGGAIFRNLDKSAIANFGSPAFMSPEQIRGDNLDSKSDMFSFGVVLYQLLTGQLPFDAPDSQAVSFRILYDAARPVAELRPDLPPRLAAAIDRALAKLPSDRFPTWEAFGNALQPRKRRPTLRLPWRRPIARIFANWVSALFDGLEPTELRAIAARYRPWSAATSRCSSRGNPISPS